MNASIESLPRVMEVIVSEFPRGKGVEDDPCRLVTRYHTTSGELLAERDPCQFTQQPQPQSPNRAESPTYREPTTEDVGELWNAYDRLDMYDALNQLGFVRKITPNE